MRLSNKSNIIESDLMQVVELYMHCFNDAEKGENWTIDTATQYFKDRNLEQSQYYFASKEGKIVGVVVASPFEHSFISKQIEQKWNNAYYISLVAVHGTQRKSGISNQLMSYFIDDMTSKSISNIVVRCRSENTPVQNLFKKHGFREEFEYQSSLGGVHCSRKILSKKMSLLNEEN